MAIHSLGMCGSHCHGLCYANFWSSFWKYFRGEQLTLNTDWKISILQICNHTVKHASQILPSTWGLQWRNGICHIFFYCGEIQNVHTNFQKYFFFVALKNLGHFAFQTKFCMTMEQNSLKPVKVGLLSENQDDWDTYTYVEHTVESHNTNKPSKWLVQ